MPMNIVIQEQRKLLGLTQEQVADYLGVSTPAVSKWEKGITSPDIGLQLVLWRHDCDSLHGQQYHGVPVLH